MARSLSWISIDSHRPAEPAAAFGAGSGPVATSEPGSVSGVGVAGCQSEPSYRKEPTETVGLAYTKIDVEYKRQQGSGLSGASTSFSDEVLST